MVTTKPTGVVLTGGSSRRLGEEKAGIRLGGITLLERSLGLLAGYCDELIVVGMSAAELAGIGSFAAQPVRAVEDIIPGIGPLGGIHTALTVSTCERNIILAVDQPFFTTDVIKALRDRMGEADAAAPVAAGRVQPLCAFYHRRCLRRIEHLISTGERAVWRLLESVDTQYVDIDDVGAFEDIDTPDDLQRARQRFGQDTG